MSKDVEAIPRLQTTEEFDALLMRASQEAWTELYLRGIPWHGINDEEFRQQVQRFRGGHARVDRIFWIKGSWKWDVALLTGLTHIEHLLLQELGLTARKAGTLADNFHNIPGLTSLGLAGNSIGALGARALADNLHKILGLISLDLSGNDIKDAGARLLAVNFQKIYGLTSLDLEANDIGDIGAERLADDLHNISRLTSLNLARNGIGDSGARRLADNLHKIPELTSLNLNFNRIGNAAAGWFADNFYSVPKLTSLNLGNNRIGDTGAVRLADNLRYIPALTSLDLRANNFGDVGTERLASNLHNISGLKSLNLGSNKIGEAGTRTLADNLHTIPALTSFDLGSNEIDEAGIRKLAGKLHTIPGLTLLDLQNNSIGDTGAQMLAEVWQAGLLQQLQTIALSGNKLTVPNEVLWSGSPAQVFAAILQGKALHEARIVVLGEPEAGKTWLCERVFLERPPEPRQETHDFELHRSLWKPVLAGIQSITVTAWDFGGQYVLHGVHEMFLTNRSIPLVVVDATKTLAENQLTYWLRMVRHFLGDQTSLMIVVSKNKDSRPKRFEPLIASDLQTQHKLAGPIRIVEDFDVESVRGIANLKAQISDMLSEMKELQDRVSPLQFRIKERAEREFSEVNSLGRRRAMIPQSEFMTWYREEAALAAEENNGVEEKSDSDALLRIVHNFGSLFFFGNTETETQRMPKGDRDRGPDQLDDRGAPGQLRWLKSPKDFTLYDWLIHPHWLKWPIYHITRESENSRRRGMLAERDIDAILKQHPTQDFDVPDAGRHVVKAVLLLTELCHFNPQKQTYLFPRGLPESGVAYYPDWYDETREPGSELSWFFFPEAAFHRLVVRWFARIDRERVWRYGMAVRDGDVEALVQAYPHEGKVAIDIHGESLVGQRDLYRDIRRDLVEFIGRNPESERPWVPASPPPPSSSPQSSAAPAAPNGSGDADAMTTPVNDRVRAYRLLLKLTMDDLLTLVAIHLDAKAREAVGSETGKTAIARKLIEHFDVPYRGLGLLAAAIRRFESGVLDDERV